MRTFTAERGWEGFHDPKSLILALVGEVGELAELVQWLPAEDVSQLAREEHLHARMGEELADILLYLVRLADVVDIDPFEAGMAKMSVNARKHPLVAADTEPGQ
jgi:dCTP diphosphatase